MTTDKRKAAMAFFRTHPEVFDRRTKDNTGGRVRWSARRPAGWDSATMEPWSAYKGRYIYPWK